MNENIHSQQRPPAAKAVRFHGSLSPVAQAVSLHAIPNVILSVEPGEARSERRTYAFRANQGPSVEAHGFTPAKIRPSLTWALALMGLSLFALAACSSEPRTVSAAPEVVHGVQLFTVQHATIPDTLDAVGTLQAAQTSQLASQIMGNIVEMRVKEGDRIRRGEVLAVLEDAQPQAAVKQATAAESGAQQEIVAADSDYALAEATFKRYQDLYSKKSVS
ncbi:MAG TPA: biotin/lipoyl-binding protein, partial [Terriglobales bacterium]|nr:biotin/lipoyl-binding protein [Terriglobales bacterium]